MQEKNKQKLGSFVALLLVIGLWQVRETVVSISPIFDNAIIYLFSSLFVGIFIGLFVSSLIPGKKKQNSRKNTSSKEKTKTKQTTAFAKKDTNNMRTHSLLHKDSEILTLPFNELTWRDFERLCYLYYKAKSTNPRETSNGADGGVDLIIFNKHHKTDIAIQIKHYQKGKQITVKEIRELNTAKRNHKCILAEFITTSTYTNAALIEASKFKITCRDKHWVENKILRWRDEAAAKTRS
ncbi:restriction endonuclease [Niallia circulans]|uniref:Restriction endonuclease n=1 Tax=Niallia circulans TaxID=1397 RepID=A0A553SMU0_NIACI|nr:restriction endonuclease [Niallia circulans]TRZ38309.1 restriction endonuclease [Niallia circulans]